eukprot:14975.XXX_265643_265891_1 [CDS] Oithona nana genome sequencing.
MSFLASIFRIAAIEFQTRRTQPFFGHLAILFRNWFATRTLVPIKFDQVVRYYFAVLTYLVKFQTSIPLPFTGPRMVLAHLTN